jgi:hypothetical protein
MEISLGLALVAVRHHLPWEIVPQNNSFSSSDGEKVPQAG